MISVEGVTKRFGELVAVRDLDFEVDLRLDDRESCRVHRRLLTSPTGRLSRGDRVQAIRNQTLSFAAHVTRDVFFQVFALTLAEVATLRSEAWSDIQDRLLGAMGARDLVPARSAVNVLETEALSLSGVPTDEASRRCASSMLAYGKPVLLVTRRWTETPVSARQWPAWRGLVRT